MNLLLKIVKNRSNLQRLLVKPDVVSFQLLVERGVFDAKKFGRTSLTSIALAKGPHQNALFYTADEFFEGDSLSDTKILDKKIENLLAEGSLLPFFEILRADLFDGIRLKVCPGDRSSDGGNTLICMKVFRSHCISPLSCEFNFFLHLFGQHRETILDLESIDLSKPDGFAVLDKGVPGWMDV